MSEESGWSQERWPEQDNGDRASVFERLFSESRGLLLFVAASILGDSAEAEHAVSRSRERAFRDPPAFTSDGEFRSWMVRITMEEALLMLHRERGYLTGNSGPSCD